MGRRGQGILRAVEEAPTPIDAPTTPTASSARIARTPSAPTPERGRDTAASRIRSWSLGETAGFAAPTAARSARIRAACRRHSGQVRRWACSSRRHPVLGRKAGDSPARSRARACAIGAVMSGRPPSDRRGRVQPLAQALPRTGEQRPRGRLAATDGPRRSRGRWRPARPSRPRFASRPGGRGARRAGRARCPAEGGGPRATRRCGDRRGGRRTGERRRSGGRATGPGWR